jgi:limonene-1,2-epoxide hydrolase
MRGTSPTSPRFSGCADRKGDALKLMSNRDVVSEFWAAMQKNDWDRAAANLAPDCVIDWPCSGERIIGHGDCAAIQAAHATRTGHWDFALHRLVAMDARRQRGDGLRRRAIRSGGGLLRDRRSADHPSDRVLPTTYDPPPGREGLTHPIEPIP